MDNVKGNITKKRTFKKVLSYICLVILIVLLFVPMAFRIIFKAKEDDTPKTIVEILTCDKEGESISSTFKNSVPQNLLYQVKGDFSIKEENPTTTPDEILADQSTNVSPLIKKIKNYSSIEYSPESDISSFTLNMTSIKESDDYDLIFININNQEYYYTSIGFNCSRKTV